jgi:hypothetical protein
VTADYSLDNGATWTAMTAKDGAFDSSTETVTASFTPTTLGVDQSICVRASDGTTTTDPIACGKFTVADLTGPLVSNVVVTPDPLYLNGNATGTALVDDTTTGGANVQSADYKLNNGSWTAMTAPGGFGTVSVAVTATFKAAKIGKNTVCVRGTDALGNVTTAPTCTDFIVQYKFSGFYSPIKMNVTNNAKGGQAITVKWKLTDANGKVIKDASSFKAVYSYPVDCLTSVGDPATAVKEPAPGKSGLKYNGGTWHYNWKTSKKYKSCRAMFVLFNSTQQSPTVVFNFK